MHIKPPNVRLKLQSPMSKITTFAQLTEHLAELRHCPAVAVVCPYDDGTVQAVSRALSHGFIKAILIGDREMIAGTGLPEQFPDRVTIVEASDQKDAAVQGVALTKTKKADILMKGLVSTDVLLHAVLNKENGILERGKLLSHITISEIPGMERLLFYSDVAVIPYPTLQQRIGMIHMDLDVLRRFGMSEPKVALINFNEKINPKFPNSVDYQELVRLGSEGEFGDAILGGPMDVKTAVDLHSAEVKGIESPVCGNADLLIFPNIESGNTFYKTISFFTPARMAGMLLGPEAPVVLPSRSDNADSKFNSLALASLACHNSTC